VRPQPLAAGLASQSRRSTPEHRRQFAPRAILHVAQHEHLGERPRQTVEFGIEDRFDVVGHGFGVGFARRHAALVFVPPRRSLQRFPRGAEGHAVQPRTDRRRRMDRGGPLGQHEERGLESVVGVRGIAEHAAAHAEHHAAVPTHEFGEDVVVAAANVLLQQVAVGRSFESVPGELRNQPRHRVLGHDTDYGRPHGIRSWKKNTTTSPTRKRE